jgi:hypothetical protein
MYTQTDLFRCGPIAVANVFTLIGKSDFAGKQISRRVINKDITAAVGRKCPDPDTLFKFVSSIVRLHNCKVIMVKNLYIKDINKLLDQKYVLLVSYIKSPVLGHYFVVDKKTTKTYRCYNFRNGVVVSHITKKRMKKLIDIHHQYDDRRSTVVMLAIKKGK